MRLYMIIFIDYAFYHTKVSTFPLGSNLGFHFPPKFQSMVLISMKFCRQLSQGNLIMELEKVHGTTSSEKGKKDNQIEDTGLSHSLAFLFRLLSHGGLKVRDHKCSSEDMTNEKLFIKPCEYWKRGYPRCRLISESVLSTSLLHSPSEPDVAFLSD